MQNKKKTSGESVKSQVEQSQGLRDLWEIVGLFTVLKPGLLLSQRLGLGLLLRRLARPSLVTARKELY